jgi:hypothetical protein
MGPKGPFERCRTVTVAGTEGEGGHHRIPPSSRRAGTSVPSGTGAASRRRIL